MQLLAGYAYVVLLVAAAAVLAQSSSAAANDSLGLAHGVLPLATRRFAAELVRDAQVLVSLRPAGRATGPPPSFDYLPRDRLSSRARNGQHHWGDVLLRYRLVAADGKASASPSWIDVSSVAARKPVTAASTPEARSPQDVATNITVLAAADLAATLSSPRLPLSIVREWLDVDGDLGVRFRIAYGAGASPPTTAAEQSALQIGGLGFPAVANSIFTGRSPEDVQTLCSLVDPYVGMDAGFLRVAPVSGRADTPLLLVTPLPGTATPLAAYRNLDEPAAGRDGDPTNAYGTQTFEGLYAWEAVTAAWDVREWRPGGAAVAGVLGSTNGAPWNAGVAGNRSAPVTLRPGASADFGLRFTLAPGGHEAVDAALRRPDVDLPVVRGVPGYVLPQTGLAGQLFVWAPRGTARIGVAVHPEGALRVAQRRAEAKGGAEGPLEYTVTPNSTAWGRVRVELTYHGAASGHSTGTLQTVHYYVTKPAPEAVGEAGRFWTTRQLLNDSADPFGRSAPGTAAILTYDAEARDVVRQDARVWIAGLSDEAGAGSYLAAAAKQAVQPDARELAVLVPFVDRVLWGVVQDNGTAAAAGDAFAVRKSVFYYDPAAVQTPPYYAPSIDWTSWTSWTRAQARATDRTAPWQWYLRQAAATARRAFARSPTTGAPLAEHADDGLMGETVLAALLADLQREAAEPGAGTGAGTGADAWPAAFAAAAAAIERLMRARVRRWAAAAVPFGSEMGWDSTAQEGVYAWAARFGAGRGAGGTSTNAAQAVQTVLGFTPAVPHWAWHANARRYWDNVYGGKLRHIERQVHHYGSALNGLVLLGGGMASASSSPSHCAASCPSSAFLLRLGYAGVVAPLTNIAPDGFASASFHSRPDTLAWDAYSGDYGPGFLGMVLGAGAFVVADTEPLSTGRLLCYGCVLERGGVRPVAGPENIPGRPSPRRLAPPCLCRPARRARQHRCRRHRNAGRCCGAGRTRNRPRPRPGPASPAVARRHPRAAWRRAGQRQRRVGPDQHKPRTIPRRLARAAAGHGPGDGHHRTVVGTTGDVCVWMPMYSATQCIPSSS